MATTVAQLLELARKLTAEERKALLDGLLGERFDAVLSGADQQRGGQSEPTDDEIQGEIDAVRRKRQQERLRAAGG